MYCYITAYNTLMRALPWTDLRIYILLFCVNATFLSASRQSGGKPAVVVVTNELDAVTYLSRFGWLEGYNKSTASLMTEEKFRSTVKMFQRFAGLQPTGKMTADTLRLMNTPRCGVMDSLGSADFAKRRKRRFVVQGSTWKKQTLTYKVSRYPDSLRHLEVKRDIARAFQAWSDVTPLTFADAESGPVDIEIKFMSGHHGDKNPFDGPSGTLAHAYFPSYGGDAHFDADEKWTINTASGTNLFQVAVHEFGHSLGLSHSDISSSLMAPFYKGYDPNFQLHSDDIAAIQELYGSHPGHRPIIPTDDGGDGIEPEISPDEKPDLCKDASMDAITTTKSESIYIFKGSFYWRLNPYKLGVDPGFPRKINWDWKGVPDNIDAAVFIKHTGYTFIFKADRYWKFINHHAIPGYPRYIRDGFPGIPDNIDSVFVWSGNDKVYFVKGQKYWRYGRNSAGIGYPRSMKTWTGLPANIDGALRYKFTNHARTYFFSGSKYYKFDDDMFKVSRRYPRPTAVWWVKCKTKWSDLVINETGDEPAKVDDVVNIDDVENNGEMTPTVDRNHCSSNNDVNSWNSLIHCIILTAVLVFN